MMDSALEQVMGQVLGRRKEPAAVGSDRHLISRATSPASSAAAQHYRGCPPDAAVGSRIDGELAVRGLLNPAAFDYGTELAVGEGERHPPVRCGRGRNRSRHGRGDH